MAIDINGSLNNKSPYALDYYYCKPNSSTPWDNVEQAHNGIPEPYRGIGKKVLVGTDQVEYWYKGGTLLSNLVPVTLSGESFSYVQTDSSGNLEI